jgi:C4-type Zn-finger protein
LHFLGVIIIRKECDECQFRFYIIAHEKNHLKLNSLDEETVEKETLKQTGSRLFPIILSNPKLCKDCGFRGTKYLEAATKYVERQKEGTAKFRTMHDGDGKYYVAKSEDEMIQRLHDDWRVVQALNHDKYLLDKSLKCFR